MLNSGMPEPQAPNAALPARATPTAPAEKLQGRLLLLGSLAAALVIYLPAIWFGPIYDDRIFLLSNPLLRSWTNIPFFLTHHMWSNIDASKGAYYRPLLMSVLIASSKLLGVRIWVFHAVALFLFLLTTTAVFVLARELELPSAIAGWAAVLFAVHPLHLEVAALATTGIGENVAAIPFVLALALYRRAQRLGNWAWFSAAAGSYALALLAKESTVIFPVLAAGMELLWQRQEKRKAGVRMLVLLAITAAYFFVRSSIVSELVHSFISLSWKTALLTTPSLVLFYLRQLLLPLNVSMFYDSYYVESWTAPQFLLPAFLLFAFVVILLLGWKRQWLTNTEIFCVAAMFVCLAPILNVRAFQWREFAHDRFAYLASVFFLLLLVSVLGRVVTMKTVVLGGLTLFFAILCEAQVWNYKDEFSAFSHACQLAPNNANALAQMAPVLYERGHHEEARMLLQRAVRLSPGWYDAHYDLAQMDLQDGILDDAEKQARQAIAVFPQKASGHYLLAKILEQQGRSTEAQNELMFAQKSEFQ